MLQFLLGFDFFGREIQLANLFLDVGVEGILPKLLIHPNRMLLDAGVRELSHAYE